MKEMDIKLTKSVLNFLMVHYFNLNYFTMLVWTELKKCTIVELRSNLVIYIYNANFFIGLPTVAKCTMMQIISKELIKEEKTYPFDLQNSWTKRYIINKIWTSSTSKTTFEIKISTSFLRKWRQEIFPNILTLYTNFLVL